MRVLATDHRRGVRGGRSFRCCIGILIWWHFDAASCCTAGTANGLDPQDDQDLIAF